MQKRQQDMKRWKENGHGNYADLAGSANTTDVAKAFFEASKTSERLVVHFCRSNSSSEARDYGETFDKHLAKLASRHLETKFRRVGVGSEVEADTPVAFLAERLDVAVLPTLLLIRDRRVVHRIRGFDELGNSPNAFRTRDLERLLALHGVVDEVHIEGGGDDETVATTATRRAAEGDAAHPALAA